MKAIQLKIYLLLIASCLLLAGLQFSCSCKKSATDPPQQPPPAGPDTTSHNFVWQVDTIGTLNSVLFDIAMINENDIWAVGEIHTPETDRFDSLGNWIPPFNAVHWNGQEWELKRILYENGWWSIGTIFAFNSNDIWFDPWMHWDGIRFEGKPIPNILVGHSINKMWGTSSTNLYVGGSNGLLAHYNGSNWQKLESGTEIDIQDIWGAQNPVKEEYEILAVASFGPIFPQAKQLLRIEGTVVTIIPDSGLVLSLAGIWFIPDEKYYVVGDGVFQTDEIGKVWQSDTTHPRFYKVAMRGNEVNDVFITGSFGLVSHYNGATWHHYTGHQLPTIFGGYGAISLRENVITAVGHIDDQGIILRGISK